MSDTGKSLYEEIKDWLRVVGIPVVIALGGWWVTTQVEVWRERDQKQSTERELRDQKTRLYAELMSRREAADSDLRKDMFGKVFDKFFTDVRSDPGEQVLKLEILAKNFNDALDLSPLFKEVQHQVKTNSKLPAEDRRRLESRLTQLARDIGSKQALLLEQSGGKIDVDVDLRCFLKNKTGTSIYPPERVPKLPACEPVRDDLLAAAQRTFGVKLPHHGGAPGLCEPSLASTPEATCVDFALTLEGYKPDQAEFLVRLEAWPRPQAAESAGASQGPRFSGSSTFHVSYFDFPLLDYTRLPEGWRVAVVLQDVDKDAGVARLNLVYFPASRASLKDKPYFDEMLDQLLRARDDGTKHDTTAAPAGAAKK
ncbi:MAG TPA: hypothetical protein VMH26_02910 [Burkholderiales bacterium]|nr:hypothetical protein [Burkholderiales bacterium]